MKNWKYIKAKNAITFALCQGETVLREYKDLNYAYHVEKASIDQFENSIEDFIKESKIIFEASQQGKTIERKTILIPIRQFRAEQKRLSKEDK